MSFAASLTGCETRWDLAVLLLKTWGSRTPGQPVARHSRHGDRYDHFHDVADEARAHFDAEPHELRLSAADRARVLAWTELGESLDMVDAVAHGLHLSAGTTFAQSWHDRLGVDRHLLAPGEIYPVADAPWPSRLGAARRTPAARSVRVDDRDHPFARVHRGGEIAVAFDFSLSRPLQDLAQGLLLPEGDRVAAALPNGSLAELGWDEPRPVAFPVAPRDVEQQAARVMGLVREAQDRDARIVVLPELSTTPAIADGVAQLLEADDVRRLVVCGSFHTDVDGAPANVALGVVTGCGEDRMLHRKITEVSHAFPEDPARRFREGIDPRAVDVGDHPAVRGRRARARRRVAGALRVRQRPGRVALGAP